MDPCTEVKYEDMEVKIEMHNIDIDIKEDDRIQGQERIVNSKNDHTVVQEKRNTEISDLKEDSFTNKSSISVHQKCHDGKASYTGMKPYQCEDCKKRFTLKDICLLIGNY